MIPLLIAAAVLVQVPDAPKPLIVKAPMFGFQLKLPAGFVAHPPGVSGDITHAYLRGAGSPRFELVSIQRLNGRIPKDCIPANTLPSNIKPFTARWNGETVCGLRLEQMSGKNLIVDLQVQLPLKKEAISLHVAGLASNEEQLHKLLDELLGELIGESSWS